MRITFFAAALLAALPLMATAEGPEPAEAPTKGFNPRLLRRFKPLRASFADGATTPEKVALGKMLYFDKRLSKTGEVACQSCHPVERFGADGEAFSKGIGGKRGNRNAPSTFNAAGHFTQFWDGRAATVEAQAIGPMMNPAEMGMASGEDVVAKLAAIAGYAAPFARAFPGDAKPIRIENVGAAIGAYERTLVTPSRWDAYLAGDKAALTSAEVEGLRVFTNVGCMVCHTGELLGGSSYQRLGAVEPWPNQSDKGRTAVTKSEADEMMFKVPSLRNVAKTAPYFHDASAKTLSEAVTLMGRHQLGLELSEDEIASIVTWLGSLTGKLDPEAIKAPKLPGAS